MFYSSGGGQYACSRRADRGWLHPDHVARRIRYAVRPQSVGIIHDADECHDETMIQLHGGHVVRVPCSLDEVLGWFQ
jgi:hypothetical protein